MSPQNFMNTAKTMYLTRLNNTVVSYHTHIKLIKNFKAKTLAVNRTKEHQAWSNTMFRISWFRTFIVEQSDSVN